MRDPATIDFWYEFASPYSYLTAMRIEDVGARSGIRVRWRPFLLGPIFAAQGWTDSPFNLYPARGRHMWRDLEREAESQGLPPLRRPAVFPQHSVLAARIALSGEEDGWRASFSRALFHAQFADGLPISEPGILRDVLIGLGLEPDSVIAAAGQESHKARLKAETRQAVDLGIFGAPSFTTQDGELFWGNDRLERAIAWAARAPAKSS